MIYEIITNISQVNFYDKDGVYLNPRDSGKSIDDLLSNETISPLNLALNLTNRLKYRKEKKPTIYFVGNPNNKTKVMLPSNSLKNFRIVDSPFSSIRYLILTECGYSISISPSNFKLLNVRVNEIITDDHAFVWLGTDVGCYLLPIKSKTYQMLHSYKYLPNIKPSGITPGSIIQTESLEKFGYLGYLKQVFIEDGEFTLGKPKHTVYSVRTNHHNFNKGINYDNVFTKFKTTHDNPYINIDSKSSLIVKKEEAPLEKIDHYDLLQMANPWISRNGSYYQNDKSRNETINTLTFVPSTFRKIDKVESEEVVITGDELDNWYLSAKHVKHKDFKFILGDDQLSMEGMLRSNMVISENDNCEIHQFDTLLSFINNGTLGSLRKPTLTVEDIFIQDQLDRLAELSSRNTYYGVGNLVSVAAMSGESKYLAVFFNSDNCYSDVGVNDRVISDSLDFVKPMNIITNINNQAPFNTNNLYRCRYLSTRDHNGRTVSSKYSTYFRFDNDWLCALDDHITEIDKKKYLTYSEQNYRANLIDIKTKNSGVEMMDRMFKHLLERHADLPDNTRLKDLLSVKYKKNYVVYKKIKVLM